MSRACSLILAPQQQFWSRWFRPPWNTRSKVLVCCSGTESWLEDVIRRLIRVSPKTHFGFVSDLPLSWPGPSWSLEDWMARGAVPEGKWDRLLFLAEDENSREHRESLSLCAGQFPRHKYYLLESHHILMDLSRHIRTPAVRRRRYAAFYYVEPTTWNYLYRQSTQVSKRGTIVEIGTFTGGTTLALGLGSKGAPAPSVATVDPVFPRTFLPLMRESGLERTVIAFEGPSSELASQWVDWTASNDLRPEIALLFVDGCHDYDAVLQDLILWSRHIAPGGRIVAHDYFHPLQPGVTRAVETFLAGHSEFEMEKPLRDAVVCRKR